MKNKLIWLSNWIPAALLILAAVGCASPPNEATQPPVPSVPSPTPVASSPSTESVETTPTTVPISNPNALYQDNFTNPSTGWPQDEFDNYFIGYHEPEWYHIEISSPNQKVTVFAPDKKSYSDITIELQVFTNSKKTAATGDFRYGLAFRRSGDQYYAFTISPRTKKWFVLKSSPSGLETLQEGTEDSIHEQDVDDTLRVDAQGSNFFFSINDHLVGQATDPDYASGEIGFYAETVDATKIHIHYDTLIIQNFEAPPQETGAAVLYQDDFTNPATNWAEKTFDNYFIGYHEPEWYHIEISNPNQKVTVFAPDKKSYSDITIELQVFTNSKKTAATGDFRYGLAFRRSGDQYYAFTISPRTKKWFVLKSSPSGLETLQEGTEDSIHEQDVDDTLRVDAQGSNFFFHINDLLVGQMTDPDYASGEIGFYAETVDATKIHIHFDTLTIREVELSLLCSINAEKLYVRSGPGKTYPPLALLTTGDTVEPLGVSPDRQWIKIKVKGSENPGWIFTSEAFVSCTPPVELFPVVNP